MVKLRYLNALSMYLYISWEIQSSTGFYSALAAQNPVSLTSENTMLQAALAVEETGASDTLLALLEASLFAFSVELATFTVFSLGGPTGSGDFGASGVAIFGASMAFGISRSATLVASAVLPSVALVATAVVTLAGVPVTGALVPMSISFSRLPGVELTP